MRVGTHKPVLPQTNLDLWSPTYKTLSNLSSPRFYALFLYYSCMCFNHAPFVLA